MDVASFLPATVVSAMSLAGISTVMSLNVNHVTFDVNRPCQMDFLILVTKVDVNMCLVLMVVF